MAEATKRISSGVPGLDEVLHGGFIPERAYLLLGSPGSGKTTLGLHFLVAGARAGERTLYISLKEATDQIRHDAEQRGFDLSGVDLLDLSPSPEIIARAEFFDLFRPAPAEAERAPMTRAISEALERVQPQRVVIDAINVFRYLAADPYQFRRQALGLIRFVTRRPATLVAVVEATEPGAEADLQFMADGIVELRQTPWGRTVTVIKLAGSGFHAGDHSMALTDTGMRVFPRLVPAAHGRPTEHTTEPFGVPELDELLHGGLERGTFTLVSGPTGTGKTTVALQFVKEAAGRGERSVLYSFEEDPQGILERSEAVSIPIGDMLERGTLSLIKVEALQYTPDEFASLVRGEVEERNARVIVVDGLEGYDLSIRMRGEDLGSHLHALAAYLDNMGVLSIMTTDTSPITGEFRATDLRISYLVDNIIFLRWVEMGGALRRVIGVLKKRLTGYDKRMLEFDITPSGLKVGPPLPGVRGILTGVPEILEPAGPPRQRPEAGSWPQGEARWGAQTRRGSSCTASGTTR